MQVDGTLIEVDGPWLSDPPIRLEIRHEWVEFWMICEDRQHQHLPWLGLNARCRGPPAMIDGSANTALISKPIGAAERSVLLLPIRPLPAATTCPDFGGRPAPFHISSPHKVHFERTERRTRNELKQDPRRHRFKT